MLNFTISKIIKQTKTKQIKNNDNKHFSHEEKANTSRDNCFSSIKCVICSKWCNFFGLFVAKFQGMVLHSMLIDLLTSLGKGDLYTKGLPDRQINKKNITHPHQSCWAKLMEW